MPAFLEPFRIKMVEPIPALSGAERLEALRRAGYNLFRLRSAEVIVDLFTDSGTGAMSAAQWGALLQGDESYAGAASFERFARVVTDLTGFSHVLPVHQGRAAERILFSCLLEPGSISVSNTHFDTTRANVELVGGVALDLPCPESQDLASAEPFKGNLDLGRLEALLAGPDRHRVSCVVVTVTNNGGGGQPVSLAHLRQVRQLCDEHLVPLLLDASRFAENAYLISVREPAERGRPPRDIAEEAFRLADGCWASLKKDGIGNIGGVIALTDADLAQRCRNLLIATEGFPTYGGLAGRDLDALAQGLTEVTDPAYLKYRAESAEWMADVLAEGGVPVVRPSGCHAVYVDAGRLLPHLSPHDFPAHALSCALYLEAGVRTSEIGTLTFGRARADGAPDVPAPHELLRLALPRRVYTRNHLEYAAEALIRVARRPEAVPGYRITTQPAALRHFSAVLTPKPPANGAPTPAGVGTDRRMPT
jgi:tryptophanase